MPHHHRRTWSSRAGALAAFVATVITCVAAHSRGADGPATPEMGLNKPTAEGLEFFEKRIRPLLTEQCYQCHSAAAPKGVKGGLLLDSRAAVMKGGEGGPIVVPGNPDGSRLIRALRWKDDKLQMPPKHALPAEQVALFEQWVKMGAPDPREGSTVPAPAPAPAINFEEGRKFWSFQPVKDPAPPTVRDGTWPANAIDRFVLAKLEEKNLTPAPAADRRALIRRATYDLTGLPPTPQDVESFVADTSSDAFDKVIDRLLATPAYGERWGRHWLDLVRYADTSGCNSDFPVPALYKYRNYVIDSFNKDKPYDQFVREQGAGDLLPAQNEPEEKEHLIATGYLALSRRFGSRNNENHLTLEDSIDNVGKVFLGLSVSCARCHDHKFDPISNADYYSLYGILASTKYAFPGTEIYRHTKDFVPVGTPEQVKDFYDYQAELASLDDRVEELTVERAVTTAKTTASDVTATDAGFNSVRSAGFALQASGGLGLGSGTAFLQIAATLAQPEYPPTARTLDQIKSDQLEAKNRQQQLEYKPPEVEKVFAAVDGTPTNARIQVKGDPKTLGPEVPRGFLTVLGGQTLDPEAAPSTSGRLELARWITDSANPLFARVMANRVWQYHFGKGLVQTPNDFGARGKRPTHPELLDWLATRFAQSGYSIKSLHKLIMQSRAYQMAAQDNPSAASTDPGNDLLWRFEQRRLSAEEIRDSLLTVSGMLDPTPGGEHPFPPESEWRYTQHRPFIAVYETNKRSIYLMQQRIRKHPFLTVFDGADTNATTATRSLSTTPVQALFLMNDKLAHDAADKLAVRIGLAFTQDEKRIDYAYRLCFGRPPAQEEVDLGVQYLRTCAEQLNSASVPWDQQQRAALASYARVLMSSNEFLYVN